MAVWSQRKSAPHPAVLPGALKMRGKTCFVGNFILLDNKIIRRAIWPLWNKSYRFIKVDVFRREFRWASQRNMREWILLTQRGLHVEGWEEQLRPAEDTARAALGNQWRTVGLTLKIEQVTGVPQILEGHLTWIMVPSTFRSFCATIIRMPMK